MAESTFGRLAVNDGKFVGRLREGGAVTAHIVQRVDASSPRTRPAPQEGSQPMSPAKTGQKSAPAPSGPVIDPENNFRFYDNRQKYLMFVNTCSEKWVVANRVAQEFGHIHPKPPALRLFDAGVGDGTVLTRVMRAMHSRFDKIPFYIVGKEISLRTFASPWRRCPTASTSIPPPCW